jgi:hypothetical protein
MVKYDDIISGIFFDRYEAGATSVRFERNDLATKAHQLEIAIPKNLGDIIYTYKYRKRLPQEIINTAPESFYWRIKNVGTAQYEFVLTQGSEFVEIDTMLATIKIPDGTPSIVKKYSISDEQALLAIVRYNRLIDIFLGVTCYSLQNHLRTTVTGIGQVETDEIYVGIDKAGQQYIIPVQAKGGTDKLGISQIEQDLALCAEKYPELICRSIACQFVTRDIVAMFEFAIEEQRIVKVNERHYKIVEATEISGDDLRAYSLHI